MTGAAETLRKTVLERVEDCRRSVEEGHADLSGLEKDVRAYCEAVAQLPREEGQRHARHLESLMKQISSLGETLAAAREEVKRELEGLSRVKQANVAYMRSDAIGLRRGRKPADEDE